MTTDTVMSVDRLAVSVGGELIGPPGALIADVVHDSRAAGPGGLFVAIRGFETDGHLYIEDAVAAGASALCVEKPAPDCGVAQIVVPDTRAVLARLAAEVHGEPSKRLRVVGVTGTNGKTTVTYLLESIVAAGGSPTGRIGTTGVAIAGQAAHQPRTTPEASDLQRLFVDMLAAGVDVAAVEVSSHALALGRVDSVHFTVAAFTNLSQDHLDFHRDMGSYFAAKAALFDSLRTKSAVINVSDPWGAKLASMAEIPVLAVGTDVRSHQVELGPAGSRFELVTPAGSAIVHVPLVGDFNVSNALVAAGCALELGIDLDKIVDGIEGVGQIPGRYELVPSPPEFTVAVDYAHSPDGVRSVIESARRVTPGSVIVVLGAGGDRDRSKRPAMGAAASTADRFVLTSDNPRSESPGEIIDAVKTGVDERAVALTVEPERRDAIRLALRYARTGDTVLVLGKGHETGQEIDGHVFDFDDREVVADLLAGTEGSACSPC